MSISGVVPFPPRRDAPKIPAPPADAPTDSGRSNNDPINILIVDDERKNLTVLETVLDDPGYRLVRAESPEQALLALVAEEFALLILDIRMPGMTGFELAHMIKGRKKTEQVPIIFLTAYYNEDQHILEGYGTGAVDYLHKPVNASILRSKVAIFADLHRKTRELELTNNALLAEVMERREVQTQLRELNETLEQRVAERTNALIERTQVAEAATISLRESEQALREADESKNRFIATLAHELRNPLAPIRNSVNVLRKKVITDPQVIWCRDLIERQVTQMARLLDDLLDVSRITRSRLTLRTENLNLDTIIDRATEIARPMIDAEGHTFTISLPPHPIVINGDLTRLAQVISNLLLNAAKFTGKNGHVALSVEHEPEQVVVTVRDSGIGLAPEHLKKVFEMFGQINSESDRAQSGLGIGLSLAKRLVEMHGGTIIALSEGLGKGSKFVVSLPLQVRAVTVEDAELLRSCEDQHLSGRTFRILVVDDMPDSADSLTLLLLSMKHSVSKAYDGEQAMRLAEGVMPDIAFIDLGMPGIDGFEVCRQIRAQPWGARMLLIAQTGWGQEDDRRRSRAAGFDHHLVKPIETNAIESVLQEAAHRLPN